MLPGKRRGFLIVRVGHHQVSWSQFLNRAEIIPPGYYRFPKDPDRDHEDRQSAPAGYIHSKKLVPTP